MAAPLGAAIVVRRDLVLTRGLPGQAQRAVLDPLIVHGLVAAGVERVAQEVVRRPVAVGAEKPEPVAHDRTAVGEIRVVDALHAVPGDEPAGDELLVRVVALHALVAAGHEHRAAILIAAVARDHVDLHAAHRGFRRQRARLIADLFHQAVVEVEAGLVAAKPHVLDLHVVDHEHIVGGGRPVHLQRGLLHDLRAADVGGVGRDAGYQLSDGERVLAGWNQVEPLTVHHRLRHRVADVDERRFAGDGDGLLELSDLEIDVDRRGKRGGQKNPFTPDGLEARDA